MESCLTSLISPAWDLIKGLWKCLCIRRDYFSKLQGDLISLKDERDRLQNMKMEIEEKLKYDEKLLKKRTIKVRNWLDATQNKLDRVDDAIKEGDNEIQKKCFRFFFPKGFCSCNDDAGTKVSSLLQVITDLIKEGTNFDNLTELKPQDPVNEKPIKKIVGLESECKQLWECMENEDVHTIGIFGVGGVGKTTLLTKLNNKFLEEKHSFDVVIWIQVSKEANLENIQETIFNRFGIPDELWKNQNEDERAVLILKLLKGKKFVLLLDDVWKHLELEKIGIPSSDNARGSKVVFTTRSEQICRSMGAQRRIKVDCLQRKEALQLFHMCVGEEAIRAGKQFAEKVAEKCQGLPLALITVGRTMASSTEADDWVLALEKLNTYPSEFPGMGDHIFPILKFSYDSLRDDTLKLCFLYCAIFAEDYAIDQVEVIELWIREGFLDSCSDRYVKKVKEGEHIIRTLKHVCLLHDDGLPQFGYIRMHDVIRDMALWLDSSDRKIKMAVFDAAGEITPHSFLKFKEPRRLSLWGKSIENFENVTQVLPSQSLLTLLVRNTKLIRFPTGFLQNMHALNILDLSENWSLAELPAGMDVLINLQYLNASCTRLNSLPHEFKNLKKLKSLLLDNTYDLTEIPKGLISSLSSLQVLSKIQLVQPELFDINGLLDELECLKSMAEIRISFSSADSIKRFLASHRLQSYVGELRVGWCKDLVFLDISSSSVRRMNHLRSLTLNICPLLEEIQIYSDEGNVPARHAYYFQELREVTISDCISIKHLTWLIYAPSLRTIEVIHCSSIVAILYDNLGLEESGTDIFSNLTVLVLRSLPKLQSICEQTLPFPCLQRLTVIDCPSLEKLPFDSNSATHSLEVIEATQEWWEALEWEENVETAFSSKFRDNNILRGSGKLETDGSEAVDDMLARVFEETVKEEGLVLTDEQREAMLDSMKAEGTENSISNVSDRMDKLAAMPEFMIEQARGVRGIINSRQTWETLDKRVEGCLKVMMTAGIRMATQVAPPVQDTKKDPQQLKYSWLPTRQTIRLLLKEIDLERKV